MDCRIVVRWDLVWLFRHKDVDDVHDDLSNDLDLFLLEEDSIRLLKIKLVAQLFEVLNYCQKFLVFIKNDDLELVLCDGVKHTQQNKRSYIH